MSNNNTEYLDHIFNYAEDYLENICPPNIDLSKYLNNSKSFTSMNEICERLFVALPNRNLMPNIIQFDKKRDKLNELLFDFDPISILSHYDAQSLFAKFKEQFQIKNTNSPKNLWWQYTKSLISACQFLSNFENEKAFDEFILLFSKNELSMAALPMLLAKEIYGLGFTLACDFLKELGYTDYPKPDVHLVDVFSGLDICTDNVYKVYKHIIKMADACRKSAYYVDKTFWLICSGKYYLDNIQIPGMKDEFISTCKSEITTAA